MRLLEQEEVWVLVLDNALHILSVEKTFKGTISGAMIHPREIYRLAIKLNAASICVLHNHPSGNPTPSTADINMTKKIVDAGKLLEIPCLDHVIIGDEYFSMHTEMTSLFK